MKTLLTTLAAGLVVAAVHVEAATVTVNTTAQKPGAAGDCTIGEAIIAANTDAAVDGCVAGAGADVIVIPAGTYEFVALDPDGSNSTLPVIASAIVLQGAHAALTTLRQRVASGVFGYRSIVVATSGNLTVTGLTVAGRTDLTFAGPLRAFDSVFDGTGFGGGHGAPLTIIGSTIMNASNGLATVGPLVLENSTVMRSDSYGIILGGQNQRTRIVNATLADNGYSGLSAHSGADVQILHSTITGNGRSHPSFESEGGGLIVAGPAHIAYTTIANNKGGFGGGVSTGWCCRQLSGSVLIEHSTISGNQATWGGGVATLSDPGHPLRIVNSTISSNTAQGEGGGIYGSGRFENTTIAFNRAGVHGGIGGGIYTRGSFLGAGMTELRNTIVAANIAGTDGDDCWIDNGQIVSEGFNLVGSHKGCAVTATTGDLIGTAGAPINPGLQPLAANGGTTATHALTRASPARDAANPAAPGSGGTACEAVDQRGIARPFGAQCDIGAFEANSLIYALRVRVIDLRGVPVPGVSMVMTGSSNGTGVTDAAGTLTFDVVPGGAYTIRPAARLLYTFSPLSNTITPTTGDVGLTFVTIRDTGIVLGTGPTDGQGGWVETRGFADAGFTHEQWARLPWPTQNATGAAVHPATGDVDGDGFQEVVLGVGRGGNGWLAILDDARTGYATAKWLQVDWPEYHAANGEIFPAAGNLDSDPRAEIAVGFGPGGGGWIALFDDATTGYAPLGWRRVAWPGYYVDGDGATHPAIANLDGIGASEIVIGLGRGGAGWLQVLTGADGNFQHRNWLQVPWAEYNGANGTTWPAAGDLDGDGQGEIVAGLGVGGGGWLVAFDDATTGFALSRWIAVPWAGYVDEVGETHPAIGNVDADAAAELVIGFADYPGEGGWFTVRDDAASSFAHLGWWNLSWPQFRAAGGALFPAVRKP